MDYIFNHPYIILFLILGISLVLIYFFAKVPYLPKQSAQAQKNYCSNHNETRSTSICHICNHPFCEDCIKTHSTLSFCLEHFPLLLKYQWTPVFSFQINPDQSEDGVILQTFKEMIWQKEKIPSFIVVEYRINFEQDLIESHVSYFTREQDQDLLRKKYLRFKDQA